MTHSHIINIDNFSSYPINDNHFKSSSSLNLICQWDPTRFRTSPRLSSCEVLVVLKTLWRPIEPVFMCCYLLHVVTLTGYNPLLCFTCTLSEMFHQFRPSNLKPWDMLRRPKTYRKHIIPGHPKTTKNPYFLDGFLRVSTAKIRVFYGLAKSNFSQNVWKNDLFELHYGILRVFYGFEKYSYLGTMNTMKVVMTDRWGWFLVSWHYTVVLWTS